MQKGWNMGVEKSISISPGQGEKGKTRAKTQANAPPKTRRSREGGLGNRFLKGPLQVEKLE